MAQQYKRILLKLSGESLMGKKQYGIDEVRLQEYAAQIKEIAALGIEIAIVIGGGNIFRGLSGASRGFDRVKGDQMVNMQLSNQKLVERGTRMIMEELGLDHDHAQKLLLLHGSVKKVIDANSQSFHRNTKSN